MIDDAKEVERTVRSVLSDVLGIDTSRTDALADESGLFGVLPELDSMAVAGLLTELEDRLGIVIDDDDVNAEMFESFGALLRFAKAKTLQ
jgi:acyl carrier protein